MAEPAARLTDQEREDLAVALHGMTCHLATGESCGVADEYDRADAVVIGATVEGMIAARLAPVNALHQRRSHRAGDFVAHGQTEFPDLCDHCRRHWPCETARAAGNADAPALALDWSRMGFGICPACREEKFIGHGPLCVDCFGQGAPE